ncbi:MAG: LuxR C-terminal-related transcriptional regulator [Anaerolineae bacterium]|nr:LuxR C-terminal-related transcriptional regulator [Anaerolineae bacterium]
MTTPDDGTPFFDSDSVSMLEAERQRLAALLDAEIGKPIQLLLAQAAVYEQSLAANPQAQMVASVLASLARQALQQIRDLSAALHPAMLESLGLTPALELLIGQTLRTTPLQIVWTIDHLPKRLSPPIELALFRAIQDALTHSVRYATNATLRLKMQNEQLTLFYEDNAPHSAGRDFLDFALTRLQSLGIEVESQDRPNFHMVATLNLPMPPFMTEREMEVLGWLAKGLPNKEIAARMQVTPRTVNFHLDNIYSKLNVASRTEAVMAALRYELVK